MNELDLEYDRLYTEYKKVVKDYEMGIISKEEYNEQTETLEYQMLELEVLSGI